MIFRLTLFALLVARATSVVAQTDSKAPELLLPRPEMVMKHREQLGLSQKQLQAISDSLEVATHKSKPLQKQVLEARNQLAELLSAESVNDDKAAEQLDRVVGFENQMRGLQLRLMLRIATVLTADQRALALKLQRRAGEQPQAAESNPEQTPLQRLSLKEVESRVRQMKQEDVAWRQIDWKTCLLDGLKESQKQKKPIILWIFIDRPVDDERC